MTSHLHKLHQMRLFSLKDVIQITDNESTAKSFLAANIKKGTICRIKKNLYAITDLATMQCAVSKYEIAANISENSYVAYHSAMEYHGLGHQLFNEVSVISESTFRTFEFEGVTYHYHQPTRAAGVTVPMMNSLVRVTDIERTVIDCIDRIKYAGGLEELLNNLSSISYIDEKKLILYMDLYGKISIYQKAGLLLSLFKKQMRLSSSFFRHCKKHIGNSTRHLTDTTEQCEYNSEWRLCVPTYLTNNWKQGGANV